MTEWPAEILFIGGFYFKDGTNKWVLYRCLFIRHRVMFIYSPDDTGEAIGMTEGFK